LPSYAGTAYYHHKLPSQPAALEPFLPEVESFALGEYASALPRGSLLTEAQQKAIAMKLHNYTGLPVEYLLRANLRVSGGVSIWQRRLSKACSRWAICRFRRVNRATWCI